MDNPGVFPLVGWQVLPDFPLTLFVDPNNPASALDGMTAVTLEFDFRYGTGGTTCSAIVATTFDGGNTWLHIARADFTTLSRRAICNLEGLLSKAMTTYADLTSEGVNDGMLSNQLACFVESSGNYANTTLAVWASVR